MLKYIDHQKMGRGKHGWLDSHFHFSFAEYHNLANMHFGVLRVLNDDIVQPGKGFDTHPHADMEIVSYVVEGQLTHKDSMGNANTLTRGQSQYMSAGTGVFHSEYNNQQDKELRFIQIWIIPDKKGHQPNYGDYAFKIEDRYNKWLPIATSFNNKANEAPIKIHQDVNIYATILSNNKRLNFHVDKKRQAYLVCLEGEADINNIHLSTRDALEIVAEDIVVSTKLGAHILVIEMEIL